MSRWVDDPLSEWFTSIQRPGNDMARKASRTWLGDTRCGNCVKEIKGKLYDARITRSGHWATLCERCFKELRASLGEGRGQEYTQQSNGKFIKTAG